MTETTTNGEPRPAPSAGKLAFLDGIRGLSALYVVIHHAVFEFIQEPRPRWVSLPLLPFNFGAAAVGVFIVLSGYCLMLPVARSERRELRGGFGQYIVRRAKRILPPYFAALLIILGLISVTGALRQPATTSWRHALPAFEFGTIASHLLLIHNTRGLWFYKIDPPMWSVAVEWQIYFLFPLLLVIWRKLGIATTLAFALVLGYGYRLGMQAAPFAGPAHYWSVLKPEYIALFAGGMLAAMIGYGRDERLRRLEASVPWLILMLACGAAMVYCGLAELHVWDTFFLGLTATCFLVWCARAAKQARPNWLTGPAIRVLESRPAVILGAFSYSLYLVHFPIVVMTNIVAFNLGVPLLARVGLTLAVGVPVSLVVAYLFHLVFERPFMPGHVQTLKQAERVAIA